MTLQSPTATLIPLFPAQSSPGADILVYWIGKIVRTCAPGGSRTLDFLHTRRAPYPLGQALLINSKRSCCCVPILLTTFPPPPPPPRTSAGRIHSRGTGRRASVQVSKRSLLITRFILNELFCHIYWKSPFSI